jgi:hypothetical protein
MSAAPDRTLIVRQGVQHCQATWRFRHNRWICIGAMKPISYWCLELSPDQIEKRLISRGIEFHWKESFRQQSIPSDEFRHAKKTQLRSRKKSNQTFGPSKAPQYARLDTRMALHVSNEFYDAVATFERKDAIWRCIQADDTVAWLKKTPFDGIKNELLKRGCSWEWLPDVSPDPNTVGNTPSSTDQEHLQTSLGTGNRD